MRLYTLLNLVGWQGRDTCAIPITDLSYAVKIIVHYIMSKLLSELRALVCQDEVAVKCSEEGESKVSDLNESRLQCFFLLAIISTNSESDSKRH